MFHSDLPVILNLQLRWHPFFLNPSAPKEGINKIEFYKNKFGPRSEQIAARMTEVFFSLYESFKQTLLVCNCELTLI